MSETYFSEKEILRARRDLKNYFEDVCNNTSSIVYTQNIKRLIQLLQNNKVLYTICKPFFEMKLEVIESFGDIKIPIDIEQQIGFVLQKLKEVEQEKIRIDTYVTELYMKRNIQDNINSWNKELVYPVFREIMNRLNDLIEDEVQGKERINGDILKIINYGSITTGNNSNVSIGKDIEQNINMNKENSQLFQKLIDLASSIEVSEDKNKILNSIKEMQEHCGEKSFSEKYNDFMQNAANHMTVFAPFIPVLTQLLLTIR